MGTWYLSLAISLFLILVGIYIHWSVVLAGLLLPFIPLISILRDRRRRRAGGNHPAADTNVSEPSADRHDERGPGQ